MKPAISIIVPVYNTEPFLKKSLDSILTQTFKDFEVLIVNDGSTDNSGDICDEYALKDKRVKVIHKKNGGLSSARNAGLRIARGEFLSFLDSDDYIDKDMLKVMYTLCRETNSDISICKFSREVNGLLEREPYNDECILEMNNDEALRHLFKGVLFRFSVCNKLFKKSCFDDIIFPEGRIHEDLSTTYKLFSKSNKAVYTSYQGYVYVKREESILTSKYNKKRLDAFLGWKEILFFMSTNYPNLNNEFFSCFAFGSVDNIHSILNQVENRRDKEAYLKVIQSLVRKYFSKVLGNNSLSFKYKITLVLLIIDANLLIFSGETKNKLRRSK
jgi:glycosyltransferase involved in cell wall biosynthesis